MKCMAREVRRAEVDQGITQRDQFNTEEFAIAETLVREPHQNSLDGHVKGSTTPVRTRISFTNAKPQDATYWSALLMPLKPHLEASKVDISAIDLSAPKFLLIEDFGTTGLLGSTDTKDKFNFSDFWRRFGLSHKTGGAGGRWGLGKLVYSSASAIGTFFGLTVRYDDPAKERILMGQAVLNNHQIAGKDYAPHIFFANPAPGEEDFQLPEKDPVVVDRFCQAIGFTRTTEPGLSIGIVCVNEGLEPKVLLPHVIANYFFPIVTEKLIVEIDGKEISAATFDALAKAYGGPSLADGTLIGFIRAIQKQEQASMELMLDWLSQGVSSSFSADEREALKKRYTHGDLLSIKAPLRLKRKSGQEESTYVEAFIQKPPSGVSGTALFVRGSITIPGEARSFGSRRAFGAVLAMDAPITEFLGDAENPAHTRWVGSAKKLNDNWKRAPETVAAIRRLLNEIYDLVAEADTSVDEDVFADFFSIPDPNPSKKKKPKPTPPPPPPPPPPSPPPTPEPTAYYISPLGSGFAIAGNAIPETKLPLRLDVELAYAVFRGDAFKKFRPQDFDFASSSAPKVSAVGANWKPIDANKIQVSVGEAKFRVEVIGFDPERDLEINVREATP